MAQKKSKSPKFSAWELRGGDDWAWPPFSYFGHQFAEDTYTFKMRHCNPISGDYIPCYVSRNTDQISSEHPVEMKWLKDL